MGYGSDSAAKSRAGATSHPYCNVERETQVYVLEERRRNSQRDGRDGSVGRLARLERLGRLGRLERLGRLARLARLG
jgi:hypothetical protein